MPATNAQKKATEKYKEKLEEVRFYVPKGGKQEIKDHATAQGVSLNEYLRNAVKEAMERDDNKKNDE